MPPALVWSKARNTTSGNYFFDVVRGVGKLLNSANTDAENTLANSLTAFNSNGFSLGTDPDGIVNQSGNNYVAWQWAGNGTGVSNTAGSITSTVSANTSAGFSVVTYTGNGSAGATVGHGLGVAPNFIIIRCRSNVTNWFVGGSNVVAAGNGTWSSVMEGLNTTSAVNTGATSVFNSTAPSSSVITLGTETNANGNGRTFVIYAWAEVAGYSKFGSYTGNGSADGTFVYTGFRPRYVMIKKSSAAEDWIIFDTARNTSNLTNLHLYANLSAAEATAVSGVTDIVSNGFKLRGTGDSVNGSGGTYIYMAFAENPFKYSLAR